MRSLAALLCLAAAGGALADTRIEYVEEGAQAAPSVLSLAPGRARMDLPSAEGRYLLFDAKEQTLVAVDPAAKKYGALDVDAIGRLSAQLAAERADLPDVMANVPPERRAQLERILGRAVAGVARPEATRTGRLTKVAVFECEVVSYEFIQERGEVCLATPRALGLTADDERTLAQLGAFADRLTEGAFSSEPAAGTRFAELTGVPVRAKHAELPAQVIRRVSHEKLAGGLFAVPSGYAREPLAIPPRAANDAGTQ